MLLFTNWPGLIGHTNPQSRSIFLGRDRFTESSFMSGFITTIDCIICKCVLLRVLRLLWLLYCQNNTDTKNLKYSRYISTRNMQISIARLPHWYCTGPLYRNDLKFLTSEAVRSTRICSPGARFSKTDKRKSGVYNSYKLSHIINRVQLVSR